MTPRKVALALVPLALALTAPLAPAAHGHYHCEDRLSVEVPPGALSGADFPYYVTVDDPRSDQPGASFSAWVYAESNGEPGLQRDDDYCFHSMDDGTPYTEESADTIIF